MANLMKGNIDDDELENAKMDRESSLNPPEFSPGMDDDGFGFSDDDDGFGFSDDGFGGGFSGGFGDSFGGGFSDGFGKPPAQETSKVEDEFWDVISKGAKNTFEFFKGLVKSAKGFDTLKRMIWGRTVVVTGFSVALFGMVSALLGLRGSIDFIVGGLVSAGVGVPIFMKYLADIKEGKYEPKTAEDPEMESDFTDDDNLFEDDPFEQSEPEEFGYSGLFSEEDEEDGELEDDGVSLEKEDDDEKEKEETVDKETVLDKLNSNMGMVTRQYLYETARSCMSHNDKKFGNVEELDEDSREFLYFCAVLNKAVKGLNTRESEDVPQLLKAKSKLFYTQLEISRVKWLKNVQPLIDEIVNICSFDEVTGKVDEGVYGQGYMVGDKMYIKIMTGETAMVTIKDAYTKVEKEILDTANYMPVVLGINEEGDVVWEDLKSINSMLVTGMPRSGKSWFIKSILAQMMMYKTPNELHFHLLDPKGDISDFKALYVPHIRKFVSTDDAIVDELRWVVQKEAERRRKVMKEAGNFIDFWDLKKKRPDIEMPLLYVVIDEVVTLAERMDKETKKEFQGLLSQLVSQLPALGIRLFMVPHVIKDQILKKTITDLIPCRISVCGDPLHIEGTTGTKPSQFVHKLSNKGDMAVRIGNDKTEFVHGVVIADNNEDTEGYFDFLARMWLKIDERYVKGSKYEKDKAQEDMGKYRQNRKKPVMKEAVEPQGMDDLLYGIHETEEEKDIKEKERHQGGDIEEIEDEIKLW